jgi:hypothetical protein
MPRLAHHSNVTPGIIVGNNADVKLTFVILFNRLNDCRLTRQRHVKNVRVLAGTQPYAIPDSHVGFADPQSI